MTKPVPDTKTDDQPAERPLLDDRAPAPEQASPLRRSATRQFGPVLKNGRNAW